MIDVKAANKKICEIIEYYTKSIAMIEMNQRYKERQKIGLSDQELQEYFDEFNKKMGAIIRDVVCFTAYLKEKGLLDEAMKDVNAVIDYWKGEDLKDKG